MTELIYYKEKETVPKKSPLKSNFGKIFAEESAFD